MSHKIHNPANFCNKYRACKEGREFALKYASMAEVWDACPKTDWLFWICKNHAPPSTRRRLEEKEVPSES